MNGTELSKLIEKANAAGFGLSEEAIAAIGDLEAKATAPDTQAVLQQVISDWEDYFGLTEEAA